MSDDLYEPPGGQTEAVVASALADGASGLFAATASVVSEGLVVVDDDYRVVFANPAVESHLGWDPESLVGRSLPSLVSEDRLSEAAAPLVGHLDAADGETVEVPVEHGDGHDVWASMRFRNHAEHGAPLVVGVVEDARAVDDGAGSPAGGTAGGAAASAFDAVAALERERAVVGRLFETIPAGTIVMAPNGEIRRINEAAERVLGLSGVSVVGMRYTDLGFDIHDGEGDPIPVEEHPLSRVVETGDPVFFEEFGLVTPDGDERWISMNCAPVTDAAGTVTEVVCVARDVTERRGRERRLRAFREAVEHAGHSVYLTDVDGTIEYVNPAFEELTGYAESEALGATPRILGSGEHDDAFYADLWETILSGGVWQGEVVNRRKSGERYVVNQTIAPVTAEDGAVERFVAVNADITEQKRREATLERHRNRLERVQQVTESLRPLNRELARASTRAEIRRLVCEQLALSDAYQCAWYGEYNPTLGRVTPTDRAGVDDDFVDAFDLPQAATSPWRPLAEGVRAREVRAAGNVLADEAATARRAHALQWGYQSVAAVPVDYGGTVFGVVGVYTSRPEAFEGNERALLGELGSRIGHAMNAAETRHLLNTDALVELEFESDDPDAALNDLTAALDCRLTVESVVPARDGAYVSYLRVDGAAASAVRARLASASAESPRVVEAGDAGGLVEFTLGASPATTLLDYGATLQSVVAEDGTTTVVGEVSPETDVHEVIARIHAHPRTTFVAKRSVDRHVASVAAVRDSLDDVLTARQKEALALAYHAGYFESPRLSTGEELARVLDVSSPTFYLHVRKATQRLLARLAEDGFLR